MPRLLKTMILLLPLISLSWTQGLVEIRSNAFQGSNFIGFYTPVISEVIYRLRRYDILLDYKTAQKDVLTATESKIILQTKIITNIKTQIIYKTKIDKIKQKRIAIMWAGIGLGAGVALSIGAAILINQISPNTAFNPQLIQLHY